LGILCFIIPGIWLCVAFSLSSYIFVEHHEDLPSDIVDSLRISMNVVNKHWCSWALFVGLLTLMFFFVIPIPIVIVAPAIALVESVGLREMDP